MDHFEVLGLRRNASEEEVTAAFRTLAKVHHPDHGGDERRFARLVLARTAALADTRKAPPARAQAPGRATPRREPETRAEPVTAFHLSSSPFKLPQPSWPDILSFFGARL